MTDQEKKEHARNVVENFARSYWNDRLRWQVGQFVPGGDMNMPMLWEDIIEKTMEPQEWLVMAEYGLGLHPDADDGYIYEICQGLAEWLFSLPDMHTYEIPDMWKDSPLGALWWAAMIRIQGDELITINDAAKIAGVTVQAMSQRVARGTLKSFTDPSANNPKRERKLVLRSDVEPKK